MAGELATAGVDAGIVGIDGGEGEFAGGSRRQAHGARHVKQQIEVEIFGHGQRGSRGSLQRHALDAGDLAKIRRHGSGVGGGRGYGASDDRHRDLGSIRQIGPVAGGLHQKRLAALRHAVGDGLNAGVGIGRRKIDHRRFGGLDRGERCRVGGGVKTRLDALLHGIVSGEPCGEHQRNDRQAHDGRDGASLVGEKGLAGFGRIIGAHDQNPGQVVTRASPPATEYFR